MNPMDFLWNAGKNGGAGALTGWGTMGLSMLPGIMSGLGFFGQDPQQRQQEMAQRYMSPEYIQQLTRQMYGDMTHGQGFGMAQQAAVGGAGAAQHYLQQSAGQYGNSGLQRMRTAVGHSLVGGKMASLYGQAQMQAAQQAQQLAMQRAQMVYGGGPAQSRTGNLVAGGLASFGNYMMNRSLMPQQSQQAPGFVPRPSAQPLQMARQGMSQFQNSGGMGGAFRNQMNQMYQPFQQQPTWRPMGPQQNPQFDPFNFQPNYFG